MKRIFIFFLAITALLCFAMPAVASPPVVLSDLEVLGPALGIYQASPASLEVAPGAIDSGGSALVVTYFETVQTRESNPSIHYVNFGTVPVLANLMSGVYFNIALEKYMGNVRAVANGSKGSRRWV
jgi:hypothetical protein